MAIGFLPIRDMSVPSFQFPVSSFAPFPSTGNRRLATGDSHLPHITEHFATDTRFDRLAAGHHAARCRQDAGAEPRQHVRNFVAPEVDAASRTADPLNAADQALAARPVLQEHPEVCLNALSALRLENLEALNVAYALENARDLHLETRRGHLHPCVPGNRRVPDARKHVCDWIGHSSCSL